MRKNDCTSNGSPGPDILCVWERMHRLVSGGEYGGAASEARTRTRAERDARALPLARIGMRTSEHTCAWYRTSGQWTSIRLRYTRSRCTMHKGGVGEEGAGRLGGMGVARARERGARVLSRGNGGASVASAAATATATAGTRVEMRSGTAAEAVVAQRVEHTGAAAGSHGDRQRGQRAGEAGRRGRRGGEQRAASGGEEGRKTGGPA